MVLHKLREGNNSLDLTLVSGTLSRRWPVDLSYLMGAQNSMKSEVY